MLNTEKVLIKLEIKLEKIQKRDIKNTVFIDDDFEEYKSIKDIISFLSDNILRDNDMSSIAKILDSIYWILYDMVNRKYDYLVDEEFRSSIKERIDEALVLIEKELEKYSQLQEDW